MPILFYLLFNVGVVQEAALQKRLHLNFCSVAALALGKPLICMICSVCLYELLTMVDKRMNFTKEVISIFNDHIPHSVRAAETSATGKSIFMHDPHGKVAAAYDALAKGVLEIA